MTSMIALSVEDGVGRLRLARPDRGNAIDLEGYRAIAAGLAKLGGDPAARVILLDAEGPDFSVGEDFDYLARLEQAGRYREWVEGYRGWIAETWHNPKLLVCAVRGRALGIGCELALLADVTYAADTAAFGHPETQRGIVPYTVWPWLVGPKLAKEYLATGRSIAAPRAHLAGLINGVLPEDKLETHALAFARDIATMPDGTAGANKRRINWAFRDVSRVLHDDRLYDVDFDWQVKARGIDKAFYQSVKSTGVREAIRKRDEEFE